MKPTGAEAGYKEVSNPIHFAQAVILCQKPISSPPSPCYPLLGQGLHLLLRAAKSLAQPLLVPEGQDYKSTWDLFLFAACVQWDTGWSPVSGCSLVLH